VLAGSRSGSRWGRGVALGLLVHPIGLAPETAQGGWPLTPTNLWQAWNWEPTLLAGFCGMALLYAYGVYRLWKRAGCGHGIRRWQATAFGVGWLALFVALVSPLDPLSAVLFSAHMVQHELLMLIAAPLLVLGQPLVGGLWGLPAAWRQAIGCGWCRLTTLRSLWHALTEPLATWLLHAMAVWVWHAPVLYQAGLESRTVHLVQHGCFLGSALLFWWTVFHGRDGRMGYGIALISVFTTAIHSSVLGALLTFARTPWYPGYSETTAAWGLSPLEDQQLAGLLMWVPAGVIYVLAGLALLAAWLAEAERRVRQHGVPVATPVPPLPPGEGGGEGVTATGRALTAPRDRTLK
jgi:putative membrane protein